VSVSSNPAWPALPDRSWEGTHLQWSKGRNKSSMQPSPLRFTMRGKARVNCIACGSVIRGRPVPMRLKITHSQDRLLESAKGLGFTSSSWNIGDVMEAPMHRRCFSFATRVWKLAFVTRALSPRRHPGEATHPPHFG